jgi:hypothetical protein
MIATILWIMNLMTGDQSRRLRSGDRISWEDSAADQGTIANINWSSVEIVWDNGHRNHVRNNDMGSVTASRMKV